MYAANIPPHALLKSEALSPQRKRLSTAAVGSEDRFAFWLDMICAMYAKLECERPNKEVFGEISFSQLGVLDFTELHSNAQFMRRTPNMIRNDTRDSSLVQIQRVGRAVVRQDGREARLVPGDFVMYDTTRPYELHFEDETHEVIVVRLPSSELQPHVVNLHDLTATTVPGTCAAGNLLLTMIDTLQRDIDRLHPSSAIGVSEGITSIIAAGLRSLPGANAQRSSQLCAYHVARVKAHVIENLRNPELSISNIAAAMRMSPDHLSRLFRAEPVPLSRWIWQQRLDACRRDLCDARMAHRSVSEIAFAWGFNDATHFSRSFKEQFGLSPRDWRQQSSALALRSSQPS
ncbi:helix-turn-helix domain-containing protein [Piscinibacter sp.]|uniref:helix-turn-helix domain-containing protein n=1 Tax=Piscinibacter sp. TaxID=1903157 RepID=UPI002D199B11|nr:helix-turn-helix domain-containing protein [Albitalea sp.]HUG26068.1 helix-turn-helix domain-containing protein [Albitalea sp.]